MNNYMPHSAARPLEIELIRTMAHRPLTAKENKTLDKITEARADTKEAFIIKPASDWLLPGNHDQGDDMLFGDFWHEGELCILFADTNVGKSILAVQIGNSISRGEPIPGFSMKQ